MERDVLLAEQLEILVEALLIIVGKGVQSVGGRERGWCVVAQRVYEGRVQTLREHSRLYSQEIQIDGLPANYLVDEDLGEWTSNFLRGDP